MRRIALVCWLILAACAEPPSGGWDDLPGSATPTAQPTAQPTVRAPAALRARPTATVLPTATAQPTATASPLLGSILGVANSPQDDDPLSWLIRPQPFGGRQETEFGVQIAGCEQPIQPALKLAGEVGFVWIKQQVRWGDMTDASGRVNWECIDRVVSAAHRAGFRVLLSVTTAPAWMRAARTPYGPPDNLMAWGEFVAALVERYRGSFHALEVWNEPNLSAEWDEYIDPIKYRALLAVAYGVTKYLDPGVMVISAGLAPTAEGGRWAHMDDREFLRRMIEADGLRYADCLGAHANGPPGEGELGAVLERYWAVMAEAGELRPVCFTEFGYSVPVQGQAPKGFEWVMAHTPEGQAEALARYVEQARLSARVKLAVVFNLNFDDGVTPNSIAALSRADYSSPALARLKAVLR